VKQKQELGFTGQAGFSGLFQFSIFRKKMEKTNPPSVEKVATFLF